MKKNEQKLLGADLIYHRELDNARRGVADLYAAANWPEKAAEWKNGLVADATERQRMVVERGDPQEMNSLAWRMGGTNAVLLAEKAVAVSGRKNPEFLNTLAAAYARNGIGLLQENQFKIEYVSRLKFYETNCPDYLCPLHWHNSPNLANSNRHIARRTSVASRCPYQVATRIDSSFHLAKTNQNGFNNDTMKIDLHSVSTTVLRRAVEIKETIASLTHELSTLLKGGSVTGPKRRRKMSAGARAKIAAAQRARWAKVNAGKTKSAAKPAKKARRKMSAAAKAKISAAAKARWAKVRAAKK